MTKKILFVCLGNICRSPAAEGIMKSKVEAAGCGNDFEIDSAGTYGGHTGNLPDERMRRAARRRGYELTHRARRITADDFDRFDFIFTMDDVNYENVCRLAPDRDSLCKVERMADYCTRFDIDHVPDPYYEGADGFEYVLDILEDACGNILAAMSDNRDLKPGHSMDDM